MNFKEIIAVLRDAEKKQKLEMISEATTQCYKKLGCEYSYRIGVIRLIEFAELIGKVMVHKIYGESITDY